MIPAISFAYENPELDIMDRQPRKAKRDHLVNTKLISFAYLQIGIIQASAGMYSYFLVLNDFGVRPQALWKIALLEAPLPNDTDLYDVNDVNGDGGHNVNTVTNADGTTTTTHSLYGNTNIMGEEKVVLGWDHPRNGRIDIRMFYAAFRNPDDWVQCRFDPANEDLPKFYKTSIITGHPICYSSEALKFAQSAYLVSIVCVQWADLMICKTRNLSLAQQGMDNSFGNFGLFSETALVAILLYVPFLNVALGTRQIPFPHFAVPSFSFFVAIFFYDELRKIWLRNGMVRENGKLKLKGWIVQNTYY